MDDEGREKREKRLMIGGVEKPAKKWALRERINREQKQGRDMDGAKQKRQKL